MYFINFLAIALGMMGTGLAAPVLSTGQSIPKSSHMIF